jgi:hydrogenase maturation factor
LSVRIRQKDGTWTAMHIARLALERAPILQRSGYVPIQAESQDLEPLSVASSGNYVAVVYEDADGKICSENFQDHKYLSFE